MQMNAAVDGHYEHVFFGDLDTEQPVDHERNMRRLRAVVRYLNLQFANTMRMYGHKHRIEGGEDYDIKLDLELDQGVDLDENYSQFTQLQEVVDRSEAVIRVRRLMTRSRGRELPGTFNPLLISQLFWKQAENWKAIADCHIEKIPDHCSKFVCAAIQSTVVSDVSERLQALKIDGALQKRLNDAKAELGRIIDDTKHHPTTYDPSYASIVQKARGEKHASKMNKLIGNAESNVVNVNDNSKFLDQRSITQGIDGLIEKDTDKASAEDALDSQLATTRLVF